MYSSNNRKEYTKRKSGVTMASIKTIVEVNSNEYTNQSEYDYNTPLKQI